MASEKLSYEIAALYSGQPAIKAAFDDFAKLNAQGAKVVRQLDALSKQAQNTGEQIRNSRQGTAQLGMQFNQLATQVASGTSPLLAIQQQLGDVGYSMSFMGGAAGRVGGFLAGPWGAAIIFATSVLTPLIANLFQSGKASEEVKTAFERGKDAAEKYAQANRELKSSLEEYEISTAGTLEAERKIRESRVASARQAVISATMELMAAEQIINAEILKRDAVLAANNDLVDSAARYGDESAAAGAVILGNTRAAKAQARVDNVTATMQERLAKLTKNRAELQSLENQLVSTNTQITNENNRASTKAANDAETAINQRDSLIEKIRGTINQYTAETSAIGKAKNALAEWNSRLDDLRKMAGGGDWLAKNKAGIDATTQALTEGANGLAAWNSLVSELTTNDLPVWEQRLNRINAAYNNLSESLRSSAPVVAEYNNQVTSVAIGRLDELFNRVQKMAEKSKDPVAALREELGILTQSLSSEMFSDADANAVTDRINKIGEAIRGLEIEKRNAEFQKSFESIGTSVSDAFKGMLTAGASWKDGMKGIIQSVIDELWRLFVVQQIVGLVSKAVGSLTGGGVPTGGAGVSAIDTGIRFAANGTPSSPGGLTWVGERGPELLNLPRGSQVIPAHRASQMGGGGVTVNVDARGSADPAAVRAQVQQGILEAAPAIIAAAQQRTVSGLRRPRLGGAIQ